MLYIIKRIAFTLLLTVASLTSLLALHANAAQPGAKPLININQPLVPADGLILFPGINGNADYNQSPDCPAPDFSQEQASKRLCMAECKDEDMCSSDAYCTAQGTQTWQEKAGDRCVVNFSCGPQRCLDTDPGTGGITQTSTW